MGRAISEQSVSYYARLAKNDGYLRLTAKAHHPSGKAARYSFDMTRFTEAGVEIDLASTKTESLYGVFSHGMQGTQGRNGSEGLEGSSGTEQSNGNVPKRSKANESISNKSTKGYKTDEDIEEKGTLNSQSASMVLEHVTPIKKKEEED